MKRILMTAAAMVLALATSQAAHAGQKPSRPQTQHDRHTNTSRRHYDDHKRYDNSHYYEPSYRKSSYCESFDCEPSYCESCDYEPSYCEPTDCESFDCEPSYRESYGRSSYRQPYRNSHYDRDSHYNHDSHYGHDRGHTSHMKTHSRGK
jgi:hypothetical protein